MARKTRDESEQHIQVLDPNGPRDVPLAPIQFSHAMGDEQGPLVDAAPIRGDATARNKPIPEDAEIRQVRRFRVVRGGSILVRGSATGGYRTMLREGKEIDDQNYDIRDLQRQQIRLVEITETSKDLPLVDV